MKINEITEGVVQGNFGSSKEANPDIGVPEGYDSFYAIPLKNSNGGQIIGVRSDGAEVVISTTSDIRIADALASEYNSGGKSGSGIQSISLTKAFGSDGLNTMEELGIKLLEKPSYFSDIRQRGAIDELQFKKLTNQMEIPTYTDVDIFGRHMNDKGSNANPQADANHPAKTFVVVFRTGNKYLADTSGASSYIRMWGYLDF
jgi:hypothetical protein